MNANADAILSEVQRFNNNKLKAFEIAEYLDRAWESIDKAMIIRFFLRSNCPPDNPVLKAAKLCIELELNPQTKAANTKLLRRLNLTRELINTPFYNPVIEVKIDNGVEGDLDFLYADNVQHFSTSCLASAEFLHVKAADRAMFNLDTNIELHKQEQSNNVVDDNIMRYVLTGHLLESDGVATEDETEIDKAIVLQNVNECLNLLEDLIPKMEHMPLPSSSAYYQLNSIVKQLTNLKQNTSPETQAGQAHLYSFFQ